VLTKNAIAAESLYSYAYTGKKENVTKDIGCIQTFHSRSLSYRETYQKQIHSFLEETILLQGNYCNFLLDTVMEKHFFISMLEELVF
jgi:hypothetical protein